MCDVKNNLAAQASQELKTMPNYAIPNETAETTEKNTKDKRANKNNPTDKYGYNGEPDEPLEPNTFVEENVLGVKAINMGVDASKRGYKAGKELYNKSKMNK